MTMISGRCSCGAVTFRTMGPILWSAWCHCESRRRATSSPATAFFGVPRNSVAWRGDMTVRKSAGGDVERRFCTACGSQMSYRSTRWADQDHLYCAALDAPTVIAPEGHVHWDERLPWVHLADDLPRSPATSETG